MKSRQGNRDCVRSRAMAAIARTVTQEPRSFPGMIMNISCRARLAAASLALVAQAAAPGAHAFPFFQNFGYGLLNRSVQDGARQRVADERAAKMEKKETKSVAAKAPAGDQSLRDPPPAKDEQARNDH